MKTLSREQITRWLPALCAFVLLLLVAFIFPSVILWPHRVIFVLYGCFIFWIAFDALSRSSVGTTSKQGIQPRIALLIFIGIVILLLIGRLFMFAKFGATALGYDTGYYLQYYNLIRAAGKIGTSVLTSHLAYIHWFPFFALDLPRLWTLNALHVFHQFLTAGALYLIIRSLPFPDDRARRVATMGVGLFIISITQFLAYWWMFYKQSMAIPFLLVATALFLRRSWLAVLVGAFGAAIHLQSAIPFVVAGILFIIYEVVRSKIQNKPLDRHLVYVALGGIVALVLVLLWKGPSDISIYIEYAKRMSGIAIRAPAWEVGQAKGLFIDFPTFLLNTIFLIPFAVVGLVTFPRWFSSNTVRSWRAYLPALFIAAIILSAFPFIYQNRTLVLLDLMIILFAAHPVLRVTEYAWRTRLGRVLVALLLSGLLVYSVRIFINFEPQIYPQEVQEIRALRYIRDPYDYVMATSSLYTPWVYSLTDFEQTLAPGWLSWDKWTLSMWQEFWTTSDDNRREELLNMYGDVDIYMFIGMHQQVDKNLRHFLETNPTITPLSPHVWRYRQQTRPVSL